MPTALTPSCPASPASSLHPPTNPLVVASVAGDYVLCVQSSNLDIFGAVPLSWQ